MVSVFVCDKLYKALLAHNKSEELNRRGFWNINRIPYAAASEVATIIDDDYSIYGIENVVIDVDMYEDRTQSLDLIKRVSLKSGYELYVVASNYERKDPLIVAILEEAKLNRNNLFTGTEESIIKLLNTNIMKDTERVSFEVLSDTAAYMPPEVTTTEPEPEPEQAPEPESVAAAVIKKESEDDITPKAKAEAFDLSELKSDRAKVAPIAERYDKMFSTKKEPEIQPEIAKRRKEIEANLQEQEQKALAEGVKKPNTRKMLNVVTATAPTARPKTAITVGIVGAGKRVGTTTQALQLVMYLIKSGYTAAIIEMHKNNHLASYIQLLSEEEQSEQLIDQHHFVYNDINIYRSTRAMIDAKSLYQYVICDYGNSAEIADLTSYLDKDIKLVVGCVKPYEIDALTPFLQHDSADINYIYSFVPKDQQADVKEEMSSAAPRTFFAPYAPDMFSLEAEEAKIFEAIMPETTFVSEEGIIARNDENDAVKSKITNWIKEITHNAK